MATTPVTINIDNSILADVENALCYFGGFYGEITAANAKQVLINIVSQQVVSYLTAIRAPLPPIVDPTPGLLT